MSTDPIQSCRLQSGNTFRLFLIVGVLSRFRLGKVFQGSAALMTLILSIGVSA